MRSVSKRLVRAMLVVAVFTILSMQSAVAAQRDDGDFGHRSIIQRVRHFIMHVLDDGLLGWPKP